MKKNEVNSIKLENLDTLKLFFVISLKISITNIHCQKNVVYVQSECERIYVCGNDVLGNGVLGLGNTIKETINFEEIKIQEPIHMFSSTEKYCVCLNESNEIICWGNFCNVGGKKSIIPKDLYFSPVRVSFGLKVDKIFTTNFSLYFVFENTKKVVFYGCLLKANSDEESNVFEFSFSSIFMVCAIGIFYFEGIDDQDLIFLSNKSSVHPLIQNCNKSALNFQDNILVYYNSHSKEVNIFEFFKFSERVFNYVSISMPVVPTQFIEPFVKNTENLISLQFSSNITYFTQNLNLMGFKLAIFREDKFGTFFSESKKREMSEQKGIKDSSTVKKKLDKINDEERKTEFNKKSTSCSKSIFERTSERNLDKGEGLKSLQNLYTKNFQGTNKNTFIQKMNNLKDNLKFEIPRLYEKNNKIDQIRDRLEYLTKKLSPLIESPSFNKSLSENIRYPIFEQNQPKVKKLTTLFYFQENENIEQFERFFDKQKAKLVFKILKNIVLKGRFFQKIVFDFEKRQFLKKLTIISDFAVKKRKRKTRFVQFLFLFAKKKFQKNGFEKINEKSKYIGRKNEQKKKVLNLSSIFFKIHKSRLIDYFLRIKKLGLFASKILLKLEKVYKKTIFGDFFEKFINLPEKSIVLLNVEKNQTEKAYLKNLEEQKKEKIINFCQDIFSDSLEKNQFDNNKNVIKSKEICHFSEKLTKSIKPIENNILSFSQNEGILTGKTINSDEKKSSEKMENLKKNLRINDGLALKMNTNEELIETSNLLLEYWKNDSMSKIENGSNYKENLQEKEFLKYCEQIFNLKKNEINEFNEENVTNSLQRKSEIVSNEEILKTAVLKITQNQSGEFFSKSELEASKFYSSKVRENQSEMEESIDKEVKNLMEQYDHEHLNFNFIESPKKHKPLFCLDNIIQIEDQSVDLSNVDSLFVKSRTENDTLKDNFIIGEKYRIGEMGCLEQNFVLPIINEESSINEYTQLSISKNISNCVIESKNEINAYKSNFEEKNNPQFDIYPENSRLNDKKEEVLIKQTSKLTSCNLRQFFKERLNSPKMTFDNKILNFEQNKANARNSSFIMGKFKPSSNSFFTKLQKRVSSLTKLPALETSILQNKLFKPLNIFPFKKKEGETKLRRLMSDPHFPSVDSRFCFKSPPKNEKVEKEEKNQNSISKQVVFNYKVNDMGKVENKEVLTKIQSPINRFALKKDENIQSDNFQRERSEKSRKSVKNGNSDFKPILKKKIDFSKKMFTFDFRNKKKDSSEVSRFEISDLFNRKGRNSTQISFIGNYDSKKVEHRSIFKKLGIN